MKRAILILCILMLTCVYTVNAELRYLYEFEGDLNNSAGDYGHGNWSNASTPDLVDCIVGQCYNFSDATAYGILPNIDLTDNFTIAVWVQYLQPFTTDDYGILDAAPNVYQWEWELQTNNNFLYFKMQTQGGGFDNVNTRNPVKEKVWQHVTVTYSRDTTILSIYHNGTLVDSANLTATIGGPNLSAAIFDNPVFIGREATSSQNFNGTIDELALWDNVLPLSDIQALANGSSVSNVSNPPCVPSWSCDGYEACQPDDKRSCNSVEDLNSCNELYTGNYSEFAELNCTYIAPEGGGGGGAFPDELTTTEDLNVTLEPTTSSGYNLEILWQKILDNENGLGIFAIAMIFLFVAYLDYRLTYPKKMRRK